MSAQDAYDILVRDTHRMYGNNAPAWLAPHSVGERRPSGGRRRAHVVAVDGFLAVHGHLGRINRMENGEMDDNKLHYNLKFTSRDYPLPLPPEFPEGAHGVVYCTMTEEEFAGLGAQHGINHYQYVTYTNEDDGTSRDLTLEDLLDRRSDDMLVLVIQVLHYEKHAASINEEEARARARTVNDLSPRAGHCLLHLCQGGVDAHVGMVDEEVVEQVRDEYGLTLSDFSYID